MVASLVGTIPSWILVAMALFVAFRLSRGGAGAAVSELSAANSALEKRLHEERDAKEQLGGEVRDLRVELGELRGRTDFTAALAAALGPILEWTVGHETRAQERHESVMAATDKQLVVLDLVAKRLGPDDEKLGPDDESAAAA